MTWDECKVYKNGVGAQYVQKNARRIIIMQTQSCTVTNSSKGCILVKIWANFWQIRAKFNSIPIEDCFVAVDFDDSQSGLRVDIIDHWSLIDHFA